jgi:hypothetical protein
MGIAPTNNDGRIDGVSVVFQSIARSRDHLRRSDNGRVTRHAFQEKRPLITRNQS